MSKLSELNSAVRKLDDLWVVCPDPDQKESILNERDKLDTMAGQLANLTLREGTKELNDAITALDELTATATKAQQEIAKVGEAIEKTAEAIDKATNAAAKVAAMIAKL
jgi:hypothetical protein